MHAGTCTGPCNFSAIFVNNTYLSSIGDNPWVFRRLADVISSSYVIFQHWFILRNKSAWCFSDGFVKLFPSWASECTHLSIIPVRLLDSFKAKASMSALHSAPLTTGVSLLSLSNKFLLSVMVNPGVSAAIWSTCKCSSVFGLRCISLHKNRRWYSSSSASTTACVSAQAGDLAVRSIFVECQPSKETGANFPSRNLRGARPTITPSVLLLWSGRFAHAASPQATRSTASPLIMPWIFNLTCWCWTSATSVLSFTKSATVLWGIVEIMKPTSAECKKSTWPHSQLRLPRTARIWLFSLSVVELCRCRSLSLLMLIFESVLQNSSWSSVKPKSSCCVMRTPHWMNGVRSHVPQLNFLWIFAISSQCRLSKGEPPKRKSSTWPLMIERGLPVSSKYTQIQGSVRILVYPIEERKLETDLYHHSGASTNP